MDPVLLSPFPGRRRDVDEVTVGGGGLHRGAELSSDLDAFGAPGVTPAELVGAHPAAAPDVHAEADDGAVATLPVGEVAVGEELLEVAVLGLVLVAVLVDEVPRPRAVAEPDPVGGVDVGSGHGARLPAARRYGAPGLTPQLLHDLHLPEPRCRVERAGAGDGT